LADFNADGWPDIYVANDTTENFLFINDGAGYFEDEARLRGCAVNREGATQASMGLAVADIDGNGLLDLYCTHYFEESNTLYANFGSQGFQDITAIADLHRPTLASLGFGTVFADFDSNGSMELLVANGHVDNSPQSPDPRMLPQLFSRAGGRWLDIGLDSGDYFSKRYMGRGVATADFDGDLDLDVAIANQNDPLVVLANKSNSGSQLVVALVGLRSNRNALGVQVTIEAGGREYTSQLCGGTSYAASHQSILHFGLGGYSGPVVCNVLWPSGAMQRVDANTGQLVTIVENAD
jgi:hypothetical protein